MRRLSFIAGALGTSLLASSAGAQQAPDLAALIECRASARQWNGLAFSLMENPDAAAGLGWTEVASVNPFLREFTLSAPITVFGRNARRLALGASGPLAILDGVAPREIAGEIGVVATVDTAEKFLGERLVSETAEDSDGLRFTTRVSLNVSTVDSHPGQTLVGCSYVVESGG